MKKYFSILFVALFVLVLSGCGKKNTLSCKGTFNGQDVELIFGFKSNYVNEFKTVVENTFDNSDAAKSYADVYNKSVEGSTAKVDGNTVKITTTIAVGTDTTTGFENKTKDDIINEYSQVGYTCK